MRPTTLLLAALLGVAAPGCASDPSAPSDPSDPDPQPTEATRASAMGFSPWQYEPPTDGALAFHGSQEKQDHFLQRMIAASEARRAEYIIWFIVRDYDALWSGLLDKSNLALVWRDTGLYGEAGDERLALGTWRAHFGRTLAP